VGSEDLTLCAGSTDLPVADPILRIPPHGGVMLLDFVSQIRDARHRFDIQGSEVLLRELAPFSIAPKQFTARQTRAGFLDAIYRGGVNSGIAAG
jgi:hypothetical protein